MSQAITRRIRFTPHPQIKPIWLTELERNTTLLYMKRALCPSIQRIEDNNCIGFNNVIIVGLQGSGKTSKINNILDIVYNTYPPEEINVQFTNSMQYNIDNLKDVMYNILIADDAIELQDSYRSIGKGSIKLSHEFFDLRHILETRFGRKVGYVVTIYGVQLYKGLAKRLRQAPISIYTSVFNDDEENKFLKYTITPYYFGWLSKKHDFTYLWNTYRANAFCVVKFNSNIKFGFFDEPQSQLEKIKIGKTEQNSHPHLDILKPLILSNKLPLKEIYDIFAFLYSESRHLKQVKPPEPLYMWKLANAGIKTPLLVKLFRRTTNTITKHIRVTQLKLKNSDTDNISINDLQNALTAISKNDTKKSKSIKDVSWNAKKKK